VPCVGATPLVGFLLRWVFEGPLHKILTELRIAYMEKSSTGADRDAVTVGYTGYGGFYCLGYRCAFRRASYRATSIPSSKGTFTTITMRRGVTTVTGGLLIAPITITR